jgi:membrane protein EpsK
MKQQIIKNLSSNYLITILGMILSFFLIPFLIKKLGKEAFGLVVLAESTIAFFEILTISIRMALSRYAAFYLAKNNKEEFVEYLSTGRSILLIAAIIVVITGSFLSYYFPQIFKVPNNLNNQSRVLFLLITSAFTIGIPNIIYWSVLYAKQRFDLINISYSTGIVLRAVLIFIAFSFLPQTWVSLVTYGFIYISMILAQNGLVFYWHKRVMPGLEIGIKYFKQSKVKEIISFSIDTSIGRVSSLLYDEIMNILTNLLWGAGFNAIYAVSLKIPTLIKRLFLEPTWTLTPAFTELVAKKENERLENLFFMYSKIVAIIIMPICFIIICFSRQIISCWVGRDFELSWKIMPIHVLSLIVIIPFGVSNCLTNAFAKVKIPSRISFLFGIVNVGLGLFLAKGLAWGLYGLAIASAVSNILNSSLFISYYSCQIAKISLTKFWTESFVKPFIMASIILGSSLFFVSYEKQFQLSAVLLIDLFFISIYFFLSYRFIFNPMEKKHVNETIESFTKSFSKSQPLILADLDT